MNNEGLKSAHAVNAVFIGLGPASLRGASGQQIAGQNEDSGTRAERSSGSAHLRATHMLSLNRLMPDHSLPGPSKFAQRLTRNLRDPSSRLAYLAR